MKNVKKTKAYWAYIVLGCILMIGALILAPIWGFWAECPWKDLGSNIVSYAI